MYLPRVSIVGNDSLLGRDLEEVFTEGAPDFELKLVDPEVEGAVLTERGGEPAVIHSMDQTAIQTSKVVLLAGSVESGRQTFLRLAALKKPPAVIDLTHGLEDQPDAVLTAPLSEGSGYVLPPTRVYVMAHPAAATLAAVLRRLHERYPLRRSVTQIFEPASERGKAGIDELHQQTVQIFSFGPLPKKVFDEQLSFNMLARYGDAAPVGLASVEERIERHLATLLGRGKPVPMSSIRLIQAPVFHGYCLSIWAEFKDNPGPAALAEALASERIEVRDDDAEPATNTAVASKSGMLVSRIETDRNHPRAAWLWVASDNHRTTSENALCLTRMLVSGKSRA